MEDKNQAADPIGGRRRLRPAPELWSKLKPMAQEHRREATLAENTLWQVLRASRLDGFRFRRQHGIDKYLVDFYCPAAALVIEVDGPIHESQTEQDQLRQDALEALGLKVIRFTNNEVIGNLAAVLARIRKALSH